MITSVTGGIAICHGKGVPGPHQCPITKPVASKHAKGTSEAAPAVTNNPRLKYEEFALVDEPGDGKSPAYGWFPPGSLSKYGDVGSSHPGEH